MEHNLIKRYVYAVSRRVPFKIRSEVTRELELLISDMLDERCKDLPPTEKDIRVVLTELGTPAQMSEKYNPNLNAKKCLIGEPHYSTYITLLKIVSICVIVGLSIASVVLQIISPSENIILTIAKWLGMIIASLSGMFTCITIAFAIVYHKGIELGTIPIDELPLPPDNKVKRSSVILELILTLIFLAVFCFLPQIIGMFNSKTGEYIPIFNFQMLFFKIFIITISVSNLVKTIVMLIDLSYSKRVLYISVCANLVSAVPTVFLFFNYNIFNNSFLSFVQASIIEIKGFSSNILPHASMFIGGVILFALAIDTIEIIYKTVRQEV